MSDKKQKLLGMPIGTAAGRLRKLIMFQMAKRLGEDFCYRCGVQIKTAEEFSIEHKAPWQSAADPVASFFDLENIAFSHHSCNCAAAAKTNKVYDSISDQRIASDRRRQPKRLAARKAWRERRRIAGLPYT